MRAACVHSLRVAADANSRQQLAAAAAAVPRGMGHAHVTQCHSNKGSVSHEFQVSVLQLSLA